LSKISKNRQKFLFAYARVGSLADSTGELKSESEAISGMLNDFPSVFTREDDTGGVHSGW